MLAFSWVLARGHVRLYITHQYFDIAWQFVPTRPRNHCLHSATCTHPADRACTSIRHGAIHSHGLTSPCSALHSLIPGEWACLLPPVRGRGKNTPSRGLCRLFERKLPFLRQLRCGARNRPEANFRSPSAAAAERGPLRRIGLFCAVPVSDLWGRQFVGVRKYLWASKYLWG